MTLCERIMEYRNQNNQYAVFMGIKTTELLPGYAKGEMDVQSKFENAIGSVHGGCLFTLADTIGGAAAASYGNRMTTNSGSFYYLAAAIHVNKLYAEAKEVKHGKKICVYDVEITDEAGKLIAKGTFSYYNLGGRLLEEGEDSQEKE